MPLQISAQLIDVAEWGIDEDFPIFPVGSKPKRLLLCPDDPPHPFLLTGHRYLLKVAQGWRAQQLWSEFIAYQIATAVGVDVPRCFVAVDSHAGEIGALVEFFYGYPEEAAPARFVPAADLLQRLRVGPRTDRPHSLRLNLKVCHRLGVADAVEWWAKVLAFDALIGNSDRHPENWGFLRRGQGECNATWKLAPAFDNGTSLGYEIRESSMPKLRNPTQLEAYVDAGRHHCGWDSSSDDPTPHIELCRRLFDAFPTVRGQMRRVVAVDGDKIRGILDACCRFDVSVPFTRDRARFVADLIGLRRWRLLAILGC